MGNFIFAGATTVIGKPELFCLLDDDTDITIVGTQSIGATVVDVVTGSNDDGVYAAYGNLVAKYHCTSGVFSLDTSWATSGILDVGTPIHRLAVDPTDRADGHGAGCLAVAYQAKGAGYTLFSLYDSTGTLVWDAAALANIVGIGFSVKFHPSDGNLVCGRGSFGTSVVLAAVVNRADGTLNKNLISSAGTVYGVDSTIAYAYVNTTSSGAALFVRKFDYSANLQWISSMFSTSTGLDVLFEGTACFVAGAGAVGTLAKLSDADGTTSATTTLGGNVFRVLGYGSDLLICSEPTGVGADGKVRSLRVMDTSLNVMRGMLLPATITSAAVGASTAMTIIPQTVFVGGGNTKGVRVWKLKDSGSALSCTDSLSTTDLETDVRAIACSLLADRMYVATDQKVRKYVASTLILDTTWAVSGMLDLSVGDGLDYITDIAVDDSGYLVIAGQDTAGNIGQVRLYDDSGTQVWLYDTGGATNGGVSVDFLLGGDVLAGYQANTGGVFLLRKHARADGTNLAQTVFSVAANDNVLGVCSEDDGAAHSAIVWSHGTSPAQVAYLPAALTPVVWQQDVDSTYLYDAAILGSSIFVGGLRSTHAPYPTLWRLDKATGTILATYSTSGTAGHIATRVVVSASKVYAVGNSAINADGILGSLNVLDTALAYQYGFDTGTILRTLDGMFGYPPVIDSDLSPGPDAIPAGSSFDYAITLQPGVLPAPTYQWWYRQSMMSGSWAELDDDPGHISGTDTDHLYVIAALGEDYGFYRCVATNSLGSATSTAVEVQITPTITVQPVGEDNGGTSTTRGEHDPSSASFTVTAIGDSVAHPLTYQWHRMDGLGVDHVVAGETSAIITLDAGDLVLAAAGSYYCVVSNTYAPTTYTVISGGVMMYVTISGFLDLEASVEKASPVELYTLVFGTRVYRMTSADSDILWQGNIYLATPMERTKILLASAQELDILEVTLPATHEFPAMFVDVVPGRLANLTITRIHRYDPLNDFVVIFRGDVQSVAFSQNNFQARMAVTPMSLNLHKTIPLFTFQSICNHMLFSEGCGVKENDAAFQATCVVSTTSGNTMTVTGLTGGKAVAGWATAGFVQIGTEYRTILEHRSGGVLDLILPFYQNVVNSPVTVFIGCNHTSEVCRVRFDNVINYLGYEYIPTINPFASRTD